MVLPVRAGNARGVRERKTFSSSISCKGLEAVSCLVQCTCCQCESGLSSESLVGLAETDGKGKRWSKGIQPRCHLEGLARVAPTHGSKSLA